jgi:hypothetical protein
MQSMRYHNSTGGPDFIARYFFRRLALARRASDKPSVQYNSALAETILVFVGFPLTGLASFVLILSLRWAPTSVAKWFGLSPRIGVFVIAVFALVVGHWWLGKRLTHYRNDRTIYLGFATDWDKRIVFWQKFAVVVICALLLPFVALLMTFGTQVVTRAFD